MESSADTESRLKRLLLERKREQQHAHSTARQIVLCALDERIAMVRRLKSEAA